MYISNKLCGCHTFKVWGATHPPLLNISSAIFFSSSSPFFVEPDGSEGKRVLMRVFVQYGMLEPVHTYKFQIFIQNTFTLKTPIR